MTSPHATVAPTTLPLLPSRARVSVSEATDTEITFYVVANRAGRVTVVLGATAAPEYAVGDVLVAHHAARLTSFGNLRIVGVKACGADVAAGEIPEGRLAIRVIA